MKVQTYQSYRIPTPFTGKTRQLEGLCNTTGQIIPSLSSTTKCYANWLPCRTMWSRWLGRYPTDTIGISLCVLEGHLPGAPKHFCTPRSSERIHGLKLNNTQVNEFNCFKFPHEEAVWFIKWFIDLRTN